MGIAQAGSRKMEMRGWHRCGSDGSAYYDHMMVNKSGTYAKLPESIQITASHSVLAPYCKVQNIRYSNLAFCHP